MRFSLSKVTARYTKAATKASPGTKTANTVCQKNSTVCKNLLRKAMMKATYGYTTWTTTRPGEASLSKNSGRCET